MMDTTTTTAAATTTTPTSSASRCTTYAAFVREWPTSGLQSTNPGSSASHDGPSHSAASPFLSPASSQHRGAHSRSSIVLKAKKCIWTCEDQRLLTIFYLKIKRQRRYWIEVLLLWRKKHVFSKLKDYAYYLYLYYVQFKLNNGNLSASKCIKKVPKSKRINGIRRRRLWKEKKKSL